ncbi:phenoxybenzoate dioxygenase (plasmid) [Rhodococcus erythropolis R138]|uniref:Rieske 2Fe-2S domain-containing protein n=1 Tax=Rhodococcus erythropolis TaxID=1833 RepID=UPI0007390642|nr:Rieske 2Fe-2S domain-containing protein [Rhodococcus erythropolis]ALU73462.1 phenoxybenzoate dioxygenase [Rhodococcus erythropolis R138]
MTTSTLDTGTGYGRPTPAHNARLTEVGPGTPMGEALRRYWHPIASSDTLVSGALPERTQVLGENLVVFRDGQGRAGVVFERCSHRGASLYYGRVEDDGIRCCYHGWKFDVEGRVVEQACEPGGGLKRDKARQPWYPVEERYGLVFVYMGPPEHKPALPRYDALEDLEEGEQLYATWPVPHAAITGMPSDFNWLQNYENGADPTHVTWLHSTHSGFQMMGTGTFGYPKQFFDPTTISDRITYERTEYGVKYIHRFDPPSESGDATELGFMVELQLPNVFGLPDFTTVVPDARHDQMMWVVPSDDTSHRIFFSIRTRDPERVNRFAFGIAQDGKQNFEMSEDEKHRTPGDAEAQSSQGPITLHSEETLVSADRGVVMLRRMLLAMVDDVEAGREPINISRDENLVRRSDSGVITTQSKSRNDESDSTAAARV